MLFRPSKRGPDQEAELCVSYKVGGIVNEWNVTGGAGGRNGSVRQAEGCVQWKCLACRVTEGSEGWRGSVLSCGGRKDNVRQDNITELITRTHDGVRDA